MSLKTFTSALVALALVALGTVQATAQTIGSGSTAIRAVYDASTGNIKVANTLANAVGIQSFDFLTLGNGTWGAPSGRPGNIGWLSGSAAQFPAFSFITSNTSTAGENGVNSQAGGASILSSSQAAPLGLNAFTGGTWDPSNLQAGTFWDLGNVAVTGMTQADINARFLTVPEITPPNFDTSAYGVFLVSYSNSTTSGPYSVTTPMNIVAVQPIPEPSTYALAFAGLACSGYVMRRRRKSA